MSSSSSSSSPTFSWNSLSEDMQKFLLSTGRKRIDLTGDVTQDILIVKTTLGNLTKTLAGPQAAAAQKLKKQFDNLETQLVSAKAGHPTSKRKFDAEEGLSETTTAHRAKRLKTFHPVTIQKKTPSHPQEQSGLSPHTTKKEQPSPLQHKTTKESEKAATHKNAPNAPFTHSVTKATAQAKTSIVDKWLNLPSPALVKMGSVFEPPEFITFLKTMVPPARRGVILHAMAKQNPLFLSNMLKFYNCDVDALHEALPGLLQDKAFTDTVHTLDLSNERPPKKIKIENLAKSIENLAKIIALFPNIRNLRALYCDLSNAGVLQIARGLQQLTHLDLTGNYNLSDAAATSIATHLPNLTHLNLTGASLTDASVVTFAGMKQLTDLRLHYCSHLSDAAARNIATMTQLTQIGLYGCHLFTDAAKQLLQKTFPQGLLL